MRRFLNKVCLINIMAIKEDVINLTTELVSFKSVSGNDKELDKCDKLHITRFDFKGVPSLFIATNKTTTPKVILNAHFDVVPADDEMFSARVERDMMFGRGVIDDKGPLAVGMLLMKELASRKNRPDVALLLTGDEEVGGSHGAKYVLGEVGIRSDFCIVLDGGEPNSYVTKAKGILRARFIATGIEAHASRPWLGDNAIEKLLKIYPKLKKLFADKDKTEWFTTMNLSTFNGGDAEKRKKKTQNKANKLNYKENIA